MKFICVEQDSDGNWGYIIPGSDIVTPFGSSGGNTSQVYIDRVELVDDGSNLLVECDPIVGDYKSWGVNFDKPVSNLFYMFHFSVNCQKDSTITFYVLGYGSMNFRLFIDNEGVPNYTNYISSTMPGSTNSNANTGGMPKICFAPVVST